jgi:hypothetical protein
MQSGNGDGIHTNPVIAADFPEPDVIPWPWCRSTLLTTDGDGEKKKLKQTRYGVYFWADNGFQDGWNFWGVKAVSVTIFDYFFPRLFHIRITTGFRRKR